MTSLHELSSGPVPTGSSRSDGGGWTDREPFPRIVVGPGRRAWFGRCCALLLAIPVRPIRPRRLPFLPLVAPSPPFTTRLVVCHPSSPPSCARAGMVSSTCRSHDPGDVVLVHHSPEPFLGPARTMVFSPGVRLCPTYGRPRGRHGACCPHPRPSPATWRFLGIPPPPLGPSSGGKTPSACDTWRTETGPSGGVSPSDRPTNRWTIRFPIEVPFQLFGLKGERIGFEPGS